MDDNEIFPDIVAEFEDSALLKVFGQAGEGIFPNRRNDPLASEAIESSFTL